MLRPFSFENTDTSSPETRNWRILDEATKTIVRTDLTFLSPVGTPTVTAGYFVLYGPLVFFTLTCDVPDGSGWNVSTSIALPYSILVTNTPSIPVYANFEVFVGTSNVFINYAGIPFPAFPNRLYFAAAYTNTSGVAEAVTIQGWYFRN
jgi:hypothetical protein